MTSKSEAEKNVNTRFLYQDVKLIQFSKFEESSYKDSFLLRSIFKESEQSNNDKLP